MSRLTFLNRKLHGKELKKLEFHGGFLLTSPFENFTAPTVHEDLADETLTTPMITPAVSTEKVAPSYGTINQTPSSQGYSSGAELHQFPQGSSSDSSLPSSSNNSSQQAARATSASQPLLGHRGQPKVITRRNPQHHNQDSTV